MTKGPAKSSEAAVKPKQLEKISVIRRKPNTKRPRSVSPHQISEVPSLCPLKNQNASPPSPAASTSKTAIKSQSTPKSLTKPARSPDKPRREAKTGRKHASTPTAPSPHQGSDIGKVKEKDKDHDKDKEKEKEPGKRKSTVRQRKKGSSSTGSTTEGGKAEEPTNVKLSQSRSRHRVRKAETSKNVSKSSSSKDHSERKKKAPKIDKGLVEKYFKEVAESKKSSKAASKKRSADSLRLEVMPESSQLNTSVRAMKKKLTKSLRPKGSLENPMTAEENLFRPDGQPVWVVPERAPGEAVEKTEDGVPIDNPELATALAEDGLEIEEKEWFETVVKYVERTLDKGKTLSKKLQQKLDAFAPMKDLEEHDQFLSQVTINYLTAETLFLTSENAIRRYERKLSGDEQDQDSRHRPNRATAESLPKVVYTDVSQAPAIARKASETCYAGEGLRFDEKKNVLFVYDRRNPMASSQALTKKLNKASREQSIQIVSKEK